MEWNEKGAKIVEKLKLRTPPVGVKFFEEKVEIEGAFKPSKHGLKFAVCQAIAFARYSGRSVVLEADDFACPPAMLIYGIALYDAKEILVSANWLRDASCDFPEMKLPLGKFKTFLFGDLTRMKEKPDAILIFGNPEQVGRLIQAKTFFGGTVNASLTAKFASCAEALLPAINGEVTIAIPGAGDRVFAGVDENELIFAMPYDWLDKILEGLENAGKGANVSYPVQRFLFFTPRFPKTYREIAEKFKRPNS